MMAVTSRSERPIDLQLSKKWKERDTSPQHSIVWTEPPNTKLKSERRVPVIYYLTRNGQLEHPHFMEVPLSSPEGLYLRDVINRLNLLRGKGMASMYSWSSKRSYKNGFVWHDLAENDFIYPVHGKEYVLKGSELPDTALLTKSDEAMSSTSKTQPVDPRKDGDDMDFAVISRPRNQSWSAIDFQEYKVYKAASVGESFGRAAADASTQTDDKRRRRKAIREVPEEEEEEREGKTEEKNKETFQNNSTELSRHEISPPPSDSSPETLESLMKADGRLVLRSEVVNGNPTASNPPSGRVKTSSVLMQLISCGSISFRDCGPGNGKDAGFSLISHYKSRLPRGGAGSNLMRKDSEEAGVENPINGGVMKLVEDKEYFSGNLIETKKEEFPALKRSSSYNADRSSSQLELADKETDEERSKCIPRKPKMQSMRKEANSGISSITTTCDKSTRQ